MRTIFNCIVLLLFILTTINPLSAQNKNKKNKKNKEAEIKEQPMNTNVGGVYVQEEVMDVGLVGDDPSNFYHSQFTPVANIKNNPKYETNSINDYCEFYHERYSKDFYSNIGIADKNGKVILPHIFSRGYGSVLDDKVILRIGSNYGVFDLKKLKWSVPIEYNDIELVNNGLFKAKKDNKWGIINEFNQIQVPLEWSHIKSLYKLENYFIVKDYKSLLDGLYSIVEHKLIIPCEYEEIRNLEELNLFLVKKDSKFNIVDINNVKRFKNGYETIYENSAKRNFFIVKQSEYYGVVDDNEKVIIPFDYTEFAKYPFSDGSYLAKNKSGKYGTILIDGRITLPFTYDYLEKKSSDNILSNNGGKCGIVHVNSGTPYEIVGCDYDNINREGNVFVIEKQGKYGMLDNSGRQVLPLEYELIEQVRNNGYSSYGSILYKGKKDGKSLLIDEFGKVIVTGTFTDFDFIPREQSGYYSTGYYLKGLDKNGKYAIVDKLGKTLTKSIFDEVISESNNIFVVKENGKYGLYSLLNKKMLAEGYDQLINNKNTFYGIKNINIEILEIEGDHVQKQETIK